MTKKDIAKFQLKKVRMARFARKKEGEVVQLFRQSPKS
jgi:hypothetical protein